jgi:hypothetical protein
MNAAILEALLNEEEGPALDFKQAQYPFVGATDDEKSELLKDILAFANSWRRTSAYILIGVQDVKGGRSQPVGVSTHLDDACLQQFVNSKTNRKVEFSYEPITVDGLTVGVIQVPSQDRPSYLNKNYGKLIADAVYIRRGSSTDIARPDEIARMGAATDVRHPGLKLTPRIARSAQFLIVLAIKNELGSGPARAPRLSIAIPGPFGESNYGVDGNGNYGLPRLAQGLDTGYLTYGGDASTVIPAGELHDVTAVQYKGAPGKMPSSVILKYKLSAEGFDPIADALTIEC